MLFAPALRSSIYFPHPHTNTSNPKHRVNSLQDFQLQYPRIQIQIQRQIQTNLTPKTHILAKSCSSHAHHCHRSPAARSNLKHIFRPINSSIKTSNLHEISIRLPPSRFRIDQHPPRHLTARPSLGGTCFRASK